MKKYAGFFLPFLALTATFPARAIGTPADAVISSTATPARFILEFQTLNPANSMKGTPL
ncbi:MAG: hypothetical protein ABL892_05630 [Thiobacillaceae bacterium]